MGNILEATSIPEALRAVTENTWHRCTGKYGEIACGREGVHEWLGNFYCDECGDKYATEIRAARDARAREIAALIEAEIQRKRKPGRTLSRQEVGKRHLKEKQRRKENARQRRRAK